MGPISTNQEDRNWLCHSRMTVSFLNWGVHVWRPSHIFCPTSTTVETGPVTHSYSIASAPWEQEDFGCLEFYVVLESDHGIPGRFSSVLRRMNPESDNKVSYFDRITGSFTLENRACELEQRVHGCDRHRRGAVHLHD